MRGWNARDEKSISFHELVKGMTNRIASSANPNGFHHTGISQLSTAETTIKHLQSSIVFVRHCDTRTELNKSRDYADWECLPLVFYIRSV